MWSQQYDWISQGDEWSSMWGNAEAQWRHTIKPRISQWIPTDRILEIAPGYGRWTQFLLQETSEYIGVDIAQNAIDACEDRFSGYQNAKFFKNDGRSLEVVPRRWANFVFSFDSLVHVERDDLQAYLSQLAEKLAPGGRGFLHHSNLGAYPERGLTRWNEWRARSVSAEVFRMDCKDIGLHCISQELIPWRGTRFIDCISVVELAANSSPMLNRPYSSERILSPQLDTIVVVNPYFMMEALAVKNVADLYSQGGYIASRDQGDAISRLRRMKDKVINSGRAWLSFGGAVARRMLSPDLTS